MRSFLIIAAGVVLLGLGVLLWQMTQDTAAVAAAPTEKLAPAPAPAAAERAPVAARDAHIPVAPPVRPQARQAPMPPPASPAASLGSGSGSAVDNEPPARKDMKQQLRKQIDAIDGYVSDCVAKAQKSGVKLTGVAALRVWAGKIKGKTVITKVAVEPIDTTLSDAATLDCLAATGRHMQLDLPDEAATMMATHQVDLDGGAITDHRLTYLEFDPPSAP